MKTDDTHFDAADGPDTGDIRFRRIFERSMDGMALLDPAGCVLECNPAFAQICGQSVDELEGESLLIFLEGDGRRRVSEAIHQLLYGSDVPAAFEESFIRADGTRIDVRIQISGLEPGAHGTAVYFVQLRDITESLRARRDLLDYQRLLEETNRLARVGGWEFEVASEDLRWSPEIYRICEVETRIKPSMGEALRFFDPHSAQKIFEAVQACLNGKPFTLTTPMRTGGGRNITVRIVGRPVWSNAEVIRIQGLLQDITELRRLQNERQAFFDVSVDMLSISDQNGCYLLVNPAWEQTLGWSTDDMHGMSAYELIHPEDVEATRRASWQLESSGVLRGFRNRLRHRNGEYRWVSWNAYFDPDARLVYGLARDVTAEMDLERHLIDAKERSDSANEAKTQFLAMMSHELRTPLNPIIGYSQLLLEELRNPDQREMIEAIQGAGEHLLRIINDLLNLSKIESGRVHMEETAFVPSEVVREVVTIMQKQFRERNIAFEVEKSAAFDAAVPLVADTGKIRQILINLLGNAAKFTTEGSVRLRAFCERHDTERMRLSFEIEDTGVGIPSEKLEAIFEPFYQVDSSGTRRFDGSGLGLAISRRLVEAMNGEIDVRSALNEGSVFSFFVLARFANVEDEKPE